MKQMAHHLVDVDRDFIGNTHNIPFKNIKIHVNGELLPRVEAIVSVFDSVVQGGDAVWEGFRVYKGRIAALGDHLQRLRNFAKTLAFAAVPASDEIRLDQIEIELAAHQNKEGCSARRTAPRLKLHSFSLRLPRPVGADAYVQQLDWNYRYVTSTRPTPFDLLPHHPLARPGMP